MSIFGVLRAPGRIVFGARQRLTADRYAAALGRRVMVVTDARLAADPVLTVLVEGLAASDCEVTVFSDVEAELPVTCVAAGQAAAAAFRPDVLIGIGGGSCIDAAKLIALLQTYGARLPDYYGELKVPGPVLPIIAVPTTAGTGSEVTPVAVVGDPERAVKVGVASPHLIPSIAICDPELTYSCPPVLTATSGADALTHAIEAFTNSPQAANPGTTHDHVFVGKNRISDHFALEAIRLVGSSLEQACRDGTDQVARDNLMLGAMLAGLAFGSAGTAAAHAVQYPVGALTGTPHGTGVAVMLPYVMAFNSSACLPELAQVALALGVGDRAAKRDANAKAAIDHIAGLFATIGIPASLRDLGLADHDIDWTVTQALGATRLVKNNPRALDQTTMTILVRAAFDGDRDVLYGSNS
jgi:alcohol dehydrogenase